MNLESKIDLLMQMQICQMDKAGIFCDKCPFAQEGKPHEPSCRTDLLFEAVKALDLDHRTERVNYHIRDMVEDVLLDIGVPSHGNGSPMLIEAIAYIIEHPEAEKERLGTLYQFLAKKFSVTIENVERHIRAAIERAFIRIDPDILEKYFGNTINPDKGRPTNQEFIYRVVYIVRRNLRN